MLTWCSFTRGGGVAVCKAEGEGEAQAWAALASLSVGAAMAAWRSATGVGAGRAGPGRSVCQLDPMFKILAAFLMPVLLGHFDGQGRKEGSQFESPSSER